MTPEDLQLYQVILEALNAVGVIGLLVFLLIAFYKGDLISKSVMNAIVIKLSADLMQKIDDLIESKKKASGKRFF